MCYAKPGPRCSNHATKALQTAEKKLNEATEKISKLDKKRMFLEDKLNDMLDVEQDNNNISLSDDLKKEIRKLNNEIIALEENVIPLLDREFLAAEQDFYTTPAGFKALEQKIEEAGGPGWAQHWVRKLETGKEIRHRQNALKNAEKHRTSNPHEYAADEDNLQQLTEQLKTGYGEKNIYIGRETTLPQQLDDATKLRYVTHQKRVDKLVDCFRNSKGEIRYDADTVEYYDKEQLTPGYKLLGKGTFQNAYLDEVSGDVIKIPTEYNTVDYYSSRDDKMSRTEQYNYAVLNVEEINNYEAEYVETLFYRPTTEPKMNIIIQPYLNPDEYENVNDASDGHMVAMQIENMEDYVPGIWDVHGGNYKIHKKTGVAVLFDCLDVVPADFTPNF